MMTFKTVEALTSFADRRKDGFYWCQMASGRWTVAEWSSERKAWAVIGIAGQFNEEVFDKVALDPIVKPDDMI